MLPSGETAQRVCPPYCEARIRRQSTKVLLRNILSAGTTNQREPGYPRSLTDTFLRKRIGRLRTWLTVSDTQRTCDDEKEKSLHIVAHLPSGANRAEAHQPSHREEEILLRPKIKPSIKNNIFWRKSYVVDPNHVSIPSLFSSRGRTSPRSGRPEILMGILTLPLPAEI